MRHADWQPKPHRNPRERQRRPGPSIPTLLGRGLRKKCPACGQGGLFSSWFRIVERCPRCGLKFERIEGHWIGSVGLNTIVTFTSVLALVVIAVIIALRNDGIPRWSVALIVAVAGALIAPAIDPFTRTVWTAIDIAMRPLEAFEVDWTVVDPQAVGNGAGQNSAAERPTREPPADRVTGTAGNDAGKPAPTIGEPSDEIDHTADEDQ